MKYIAPTMKIEEAQVVSMLAESLPIIKDKTVSGDDALTKESFAWDIWGEDWSSLPKSCQLTEHKLSPMHECVSGIVV